MVFKTWFIRLGRRYRALPDVLAFVVAHPRVCSCVRTFRLDCPDVPRFFPGDAKFYQCQDPVDPVAFATLIRCFPTLHRLQLRDIIPANGDAEVSNAPSPLVHIPNIDIRVPQQCEGGPIMVVRRLLSSVGSVDSLHVRSWYMDTGCVVRVVVIDDSPSSSRPPSPFPRPPSPPPPPRLVLSVDSLTLSGGIPSWPFDTDVPFLQSLRRLSVSELNTGWSQHHVLGQARSLEHVELSLPHYKNCGEYCMPLYNHADRLSMPSYFIS